MTLRRSARTIWLTTLLACSADDTPASDAGTRGDSAQSAPGDEDASSGDRDASPGASDSDGALDSAVGDELGFEEYDTQQVALFCRQMFECVIPNDDWLGAEAVLRTQARCRQHYGPIFVRSSSRRDLKLVISLGTARFDGAAAARCLALPFSCTRPLRGPLPCADIWVGTVAVSGTCYRSEECAPGARTCGS